MKNLFRSSRDLPYIAALLLIALATWTAAYAESGNSGPRGGPGSGIGSCLATHGALQKEAWKAVTRDELDQIRARIMQSCALSEERADCVIHGIQSSRPLDQIQTDCEDSELAGGNTA